MTEPQTPNIGLISPNTGDLSGTWGSAAINPNNLVVDGYIGGSVSIALSNSPVTLGVPAGFTPTPSAGPTQSQNARILFSGALSANVTITFTLPGYYIIENTCSNTANFYVQLASAGAGKTIGAIPNKKMHVFHDGTNMDYVNLPDPGTAYDLHGWTTYPPWMLACTTKPYLIKDGSSQLTSTYPGLFAAIGYTYGGAGGNFTLPDERARMRIAYDPGNTGRVNSTVNAGTLGSAGGAQVLSAGSIPQISGPYTPQGTVTLTTNQTWGGPSSNFGVVQQGVTGAQPLQTPNATFNFAGTPATITVGTALPGQALPPAIVACLALIKT